MALAGKLEDVQPAEILQFLAMSEKTGKLTFTTGTEEGLIVFRRGRIVYAASSSVRETFGSIAIGFGLVDPGQLNQALLLQHRSRIDKRLGSILVELGVLTTDDLQRVLQHQVMQVLHEMFAWDHGFFRFRSLELEDSGEVEVDARDLLVDTPLDARSVALDAARLRDEEDRDAGATRPRAAGRLGSVETPDLEAPLHASVGALMGDVAAPLVTAEAVREIFEVAAKVFSRGVVLAVHGHSMRGLAQFGLADGDDPPSQRVRRLWLPVDGPSVAAHVVATGAAFRGAPERNRWNEALFEVLGGAWPDEGVALPVKIDHRVALVFYGDNEPDDLPVGSTMALEKKLAAVATSLVKSRG
ncbi:MAG TPA: DUF4388 domain-containing protein [Thermoanaerobaculales bacterium]|nr:DUF4388 domain-containing protein [Thermoanaerobaculales bacterium]